MNNQRLLLFVPLAVFAILALFFWRGLSLDPYDMPSALLNKPVPAFRLPVLAAKENPAGVTEMHADSLKGQVSLLNVWATWCVTCREEHEFLLSLRNQGIAIFGVNYKDEKDKAEDWLKTLHNPYVMSAIDADGRLGLNLGVFGAPETYVVDSQGVIRFRHVGAVDAKVWEEKLKPVMDQLNH